MKYYLIDTENTGNRWTNCLSELSENDQLILFHTDNNKNQSVTFEQLSTASRFGTISIAVIACEQGNNALDFQLASYLGMLVANSQPEADTFIIMTYDKGYDPLITFWQKQGVSIYRQEPCCHAQPPLASVGTDELITPIYSSQQAPQHAKKTTGKHSGPKTRLDTVRTAYVRMVRDAGITDGIAIDKTANVMMHTMGLPKQGRSLQIQNQMRQAFGQHVGMNLYRKLKPLFDNVGKNGPYPPAKKK